MEGKVCNNDASEAKRSRYHCEQLEEEEDYELELHQSGALDEFELTGDKNENDWEEDEEENVKVEIRNNQHDSGCADMGFPAAPDAFKSKPKGRYYSKVRHGTGSDATETESVTDDHQRMLLKRPFEGTVVNYERETDPVVIGRRTKQIEYGKNTPEYFNYSRAVPRDSREPSHPKTPNKHRKYSRRAWDGIVKQWRINLHCWSDYPISASEQVSVTESDAEKLNESFTSEASGSTSTTSSVAAAFSADLGFLTSASKKRFSRCTSRSASDSDTASECTNADDKYCLDSTVVEKKDSRINQVKAEEAEFEKTILSTSWADEVEDYYDLNKCNA